MVEVVTDVAVMEVADTVLEDTAAVGGEPIVTVDMEADHTQMHQLALTSLLIQPQLAVNLLQLFLSQM